MSLKRNPRDYSTGGENARERVPLGGVVSDVRGEFRVRASRVKWDCKVYNVHLCKTKSCFHKVACTTRPKYWLLHSRITGWSAKTSGKKPGFIFLNSANSDNNRFTGHFDVWLLLGCLDYANISDSEWLRFGSPLLVGLPANSPLGAALLYIHALWC